MVAGVEKLPVKPTVPSVMCRPLYFGGSEISHKQTWNNLKDLKKPQRLTQIKL